MWQESMKSVQEKIWSGVNIHTWRRFHKSSLDISGVYQAQLINKKSDSWFIKTTPSRMLDKQSKVGFSVKQVSMRSHAVQQ